MADHWANKASKERQQIRMIGFGAAAVFILFSSIVGYKVYSMFRIDVPAKNIAVLTTLTGKDLSNDDEIAPDIHHKGLQQNVLTEGRYFYNIYHYSWSVYPMVEIPEGKMGIRIRLYGKDLGYGNFVATEDDQKGIVKEVLRPGRYPLNALVQDGATIVSPRPKNDYAEIVELHDPVSIPAGYKGIVCNLAGPMPEDPNQLLVPAGFRGAQQETLGEGTYYMNPYMYKIIPIDCRSQRFNIADAEDMGFPSKDGFWVSLDGIIEFRIRPDKAAEIYVLYNETFDKQTDLDKDIIRKIVLPNARSFCRMRGSSHSGREFIGGETRSKFQTEFQSEMQRACDDSGIEIIQALITKINPPQAIAGPVRDREIAHQKMRQFQEQTSQQEQEAKLAIEKALIKQKQALVTAEQEVVLKTTMAMQEQRVAVTKAEELSSVAERDLSAANDKAAAMMSRATAEAGIANYANQAEAAGWKTAVNAMGTGEEYARFILYQKLAPAFKSMTTNTKDSPLMDIFKNYQQKKEVK